MEDPQPMYRQIESQLRDFILAGAIKPGTRLPTIRTLASDLSCSVITTQRAYRDLEDEGLILTRQGRGTVVATIPEEKMNARRREAVEAAFGEAVRAGRRAGLTEQELRDVLNEELQRDHTDVSGGVS
jgi:GntR family transcriptional regulator